MCTHDAGRYTGRRFESSAAGLAPPAAAGAVLNRVRASHPQRETIA